MRIGYACINTALAEKKILINRSMIRKTFQEKGIAFASALAMKNIEDLETIVDWNICHGLMLYRMSSDMFPWMSEYELQDLPDYSAIRSILERIGKKALATGTRLTYHPGPFNVLASRNPDVVRKTVKELAQHGEVMDMIGLPRTPFAKVNIHIGGAYGDRHSAILRFIDNFAKLPVSVATRLTVENDDRPNMFSVTDLLTVHEATGVPIVFDYHHHAFRSGDLTVEEAMSLACDTWPKGIIPIVHFSSPRRQYEDPKAPMVSHADFVYEPINAYGRHVDIMLEAKAKEQAALRFIASHSH